MPSMPTSLDELKLVKLRELREKQERNRQLETELHVRQADRLRTDPVAWVDERLGEHIWSKQVQILKSLNSHRRTAVKSCHGVGKSHVASRAVGWWLDTHPDGFVVTTAPSFQQVKAVLWRYIRQMHRKGLRGTVNQTEWHLDGDLIAYGRKPADKDDTAFQGIHAEHVLVVLDEASGVPEELWDAAASLTTSEGSSILAIGNPADPLSRFAKVCQPGSGWNVITISTFDAPFFTGEKVPADVAARLPTQIVLDDARSDYGEDSPLWQWKILGEFPEDATDQVVRSSDLAKCQIERDMPYTESELTPVVLGVDVGGGGDETVVRERRGRMVGREWRERDDDTMSVVRLVQKAQQITGATLVNIDYTGIGAGPADRLQELANLGQFPARIGKIKVGSQARDPKLYTNLKAEIWWEIGRKLSEHGGWDLAPAVYDNAGGWLAGAENIDKTAAQLLSVKWFTDAAGRIVIEKKEDVIARIGRSPDNADALLLAFYTPPRGGFATFVEGWIAQKQDVAVPKPAFDIAALKAS